jgi:hypothetical protein
VAEPLLPAVPDEEVLGPSLDAGSGLAARRRFPVSRWVAWVVIGLLLLAIFWGLLVIAP